MMKSVTKEKVFHVLKLVLLSVTVTLVLLSLLGTVAHASGLVDDTVNADNLYSKYPLSNYQLDFYVDNSWSWLPWNWLDGIGKSVQYGLYCITNFVWTISLYLSNATGYVVQQAYKLDFIALSSIHDEIYLKRSMGVVATLFVILIIPELWKNRSCECMEIEATSYYSLKQVYATRMLLFGVTDIFLITVFLGVVSAGLHYELSELVVQFLFPLCVTACICFGILCSKHSFSETVAIVLCVIWSAVWLFIVLNENVYIMVTVPIWSALLGATILFIAFAIYRVLKNCNQYLEVSFDEIRA